MVQALGALQVKHAVGLPECAKIVVDEDGDMCNLKLLEHLVVSELFIKHKYTNGT